ncbi:MAG: hypothetical protein O2779_03770 [Nanoarchaeota archaeon]|nr:hypothetical protein [Nanoarchaeota archaeon]
MNFKPTQLKIIGSILVAGIFSSPLHASLFPCKAIAKDIPGLTADPICAVVPLYALSTFWFVVFLLWVITYTVWSSIAKK